MCRTLGIAWWSSTLGRRRTSTRPRRSFPSSRPEAAFWVLDLTSACADPMFLAEVVPASAHPRARWTRRPSTRRHGRPRRPAGPGRGEGLGDGGIRVLQGTAASSIPGFSEFAVKTALTLRTVCRLGIEPSPAILSKVDEILLCQPGADGSRLLHGVHAVHRQPWKRSEDDGPEDDGTYSDSRAPAGGPGRVVVPCAENDEGLSS